MADLTLLRNQSGTLDFQASGTYEQAAAPSNSDTIVLDSGSPTLTNLSGSLTGLNLYIGPNFNGTIDGLAMSNIATLVMHAGSSAYVKLSTTVTGSVLKTGGGRLVVNGSALPALYAFDTSGITILEACDLSAAYLTRTRGTHIYPHASAIIDTLRLSGGDCRIERDLDQGDVTDRAYLHMLECAANDGAGGAELRIDNGGRVAVEAHTAQTFDDVKGFDGSLDIGKSTVAPTFTAMLRTAKFSFQRYTGKGDAATDSSPSLIGGDGTMASGGGKSL